MYKANLPFNTPFEILVCETQKINGVVQKKFIPKYIIWCSAKSYGGTERIINDKIIIEDTIEIETWFTPRLKNNCRLKLLNDDSEFEIVTPIENIEMKNKYMKFKIKRIQGGA